jgi:hypothetical protein
MTIVGVQKLVTGQFDLVLRLTEKEGLDLASLIVQQQELTQSPPPPPSTEGGTSEEPKS